MLTKANMDSTQPTNAVNNEDDEVSQFSITQAPQDIPWERANPVTPEQALLFRPWVIKIHDLDGSTSTSACEQAKEIIKKLPLLKLPPLPCSKKRDSSLKVIDTSLLNIYSTNPAKLIKTIWLLLYPLTPNTT